MVALALAGPAPATDGAANRILVLPVEVRGRETATFQAAVSEAVHEGLLRGQYKLVEGDDASSCASHECAGEAARKAGARFAVRVTVVASHRVYELAIAVVDAESARLVAEANDTCDLCGLEEVVQMVDEQSASIRRRLDALVTEPPVIAFESEPPAAAIELDGARIGVTPIARPVAPGDHRARAVLDGWVPQERTFTAVAGVRDVVRFELQRVARRDRRPLLRALGWSALGVGLAAVGVGAGLVAIDHDPVKTRCTGNNVDLQGDCRYVYLTQGAGIGLVATGGALLVTAVALLVVGRKRGLSSRSPCGRFACASSRSIARDPRPTAARPSARRPGAR
ncbi:MAG TPA: PEGA domain-containing protein [Nannocystaceae bacterium]|nr:PEGA domain-containing protein [Nannocystaceae bacterium]